MTRSLLLLGCIAVLAQHAQANPEQQLKLQTLNDQALHLHAQGQYTQAAEHYEAMLPLIDQQFGEDSTEKSQILASLADTQLARKQYDQAEQHYRRALAVQADKDAGLLKADILNGLASSLYLQRRFSEAEPFYLEANTLLQSLPQAPADRQLLILDNLGALYESLHDRQEASHYRRLARELRRQQ